MAQRPGQAAAQNVLGMGDRFDAVPCSERRDSLTVRADPQCPVCGESPTVTSLVDYQRCCRVCRCFR